MAFVAALASDSSARTIQTLETVKHFVQTECGVSSWGGVESGRNLRKMRMNISEKRTLRTRHSNQTPEV